MVAEEPAGQPMMHLRRRMVPWLVALSSIAFGAGIVLPLFTIQPGAGVWTSLVRLCAADQMQSRTLTLPGGILQLWQGGEVGLTILLGLLSLVLPIAKLSVLWWECFLVGDMPEPFFDFFRAISRYAMVEVFVVALLVMLVKSLPGGSSITLHLGTAAFTASVVLSLIASQWSLPRTSQNASSSDPT